MKRWLFAAVAFSSALALSSFVAACHSGSGYAYDQVQADLPVAGSDSVAVATLDHREAVVKQGRSPDFVGVLQQSPSKTLTVTTTSGAPLASDVSNVIGRALETSGFSVERVELDPQSSEQQGFEQLKTTHKKHLLLLVMKRWESETDKNTELYFDLSLSVYNDAGALQGRSEADGTDQFAPSGSSSFSEIEGVLTEALGRKLSLLFSEPKIQEAFRREL